MELLSPAGGLEQLKVALHFGADAVYVGLRRWGMRARAENLALEELDAAVSYAHERSAAVHLTLNTLMSDEDVNDLGRILPAIAECGPDAAIVSDLGAIELVRRLAPDVRVHLSTQASVMNVRAADAYARMGVTRIVLAREMSLDQIREFRRRCSDELELEVFAHGSMCMAISGRCLLSAELMGRARSASAGACAQPCRWGYALVEDRTPDRRIPICSTEGGTYLLSSNDLCMIEHLDEVEAAGVCAIKLEGRAKGSYYTAVVTNCYRQVLDGASCAPWRAELELVSHRPYSTGFFFGDPTQNPGHVDYVRERTMVGVVESSSFDGRQGVWRTQVRCRNRAEVGAWVDVLSPHQPVRSCTLSAGLIRTMDVYELAIPFRVGPLDVLALSVA